LTGKNVIRQGLDGHPFDWHKFLYDLSIQILLYVINCWRLSTSLPLHFFRNCNHSFALTFRNRPLWRFRDRPKGHCGRPNRRAEPL
jgi:hypothetical protein